MAKLESKQNAALRTILGAPPWTKTVNLRAELHLPALKHRIIQTTATLVAKMAHTPRVYSAPARVLAAAARDERLPRKTNWVHAAGDTLATT